MSAPDAPATNTQSIAAADGVESAVDHADPVEQTAALSPVDPNEDSKASNGSNDEEQVVDDDAVAQAVEPLVRADDVTTTTRPSAERRSRGAPVLPSLLAASILLGAGAWIVKRLLARLARAPKPARSSALAQEAPAAPPPEPEPVDPDSLEIIVSPAPATAAPSASPVISTLPPSLSNVTLVVSEDVDLAGAPTTLGSPGACLAAAATSSCPAVVRLQEAGAVVVGKAAVQPLGLDTLGANFGNPYNKAHVSGGPHTGSAAAVATGMAQAALCSDLVGAARVPAACCGLYCYRSTPGALGHVNVQSAAAAASSSSSKQPPLDAVSLMTADPGVMLRAAQALRAPGSFELRGEIVRFVVAEDLFASCAVEYQPAGLAIKRAILKWAGSEQAGAVQLCKFLADNSGGWQSLAPDELLAGIGGLPAGLAAWATAGRVLQAAHLHALLPELSQRQQQQQGQQQAAKDNEEEVQGEKSNEGKETVADDGAAGDRAGDGSAAAVEAEADGGDAVAKGTAEEGESGAAEGRAETSAGGEAAAAIASPADQPGPGAEVESEMETQAAAALLPPAPAADRLAAAQEVARQLYDTLRHTVKPDTVIVLPVVPTAPMRRRDVTAGAAAGGGASLEARAWEALTACFNCLATLAQCPVVIVPLGTVADGTPLAAALMGCSRFDARLIAVAAKMGPVMQEAFEGVKEGLAEAVRKQQEGAAEVQPPPPSAAGGRGGAAAAAAAAAPPPAGAAPPPPGSATAPPVVDQRRVDRAERFKAKGNELFKSGKFAEALAEYSKAINEHPDNPVYYNNRAMACLKIFRFEQAEEDCNRALKFDLKEADKAKALLRRATARTALQKYPEAERDLRQVLSVEPNNRQAREDLQNLQQMKADMAAAQQRMVAEFQAQRMMAAGAAPGAPPAGAAAPGAGAGRGGPAAGGPGFPGFPPMGIDPSTLPPGFDWSQLAGAGGPEALMQMMGGGPEGLGPGGLGPMFGGSGGPGAFQRR